MRPLVIFFTVRNSHAEHTSEFYNRVKLCSVRLFSITFQRVSNLFDKSKVDSVSSFSKWWAWDMLFELFDHFYLFEMCTNMFANICRHQSVLYQYYVWLMHMCRVYEISLVIKQLTIFQQFHRLFIYLLTLPPPSFEYIFN